MNVYDRYNGLNMMYLMPRKKQPKVDDETKVDYGKGTGPEIPWSIGLPWV